MTPSLEQVESALAEVLDPEYPVSLLDMGLIRRVDVDAGTATIAIAYCSLGCPCIGLIEQDVKDRVLQLEGIERVEVVESFDPWTRKNISRKGLDILRGSGVG